MVVFCKSCVAESPRVDHSATHQPKTPGFHPVVNVQQNGDRAFFFETICWPRRSVPRDLSVAGVHTKVCLEEEDSSVDSIRIRGWQFADSRLGNHVAAVHVRLGRVVGGGGARCGVTPKGPSNSPVLHPIASAKQRGRRCNGR